MSLNHSNPSPLPLTLRVTGLWLIWAAWCSAAGWGLSVVHGLCGWGHLALLPVLLALSCCWWHLSGSGKETPAYFSKWRGRFRQPLPLLYFAIAGFSLLAGALNDHPWSIDAIGYRLPRVLHWWSEHRWYWIGTVDHRLDYSSTGFEWQMLPLMELANSDRLIFLLNWVPFLLMPGLVFLTLCACGVNRRSARRWMWLLPSGYGYALQCSGLQNDGYTVNYLLAALAFAQFAYSSRRASGLWFCLLAAALLTGAKLSNLPLLLPIGVAMLPALGRVKWLNWRLAVIIFIALFCSFLPTAALNLHYTGDWTGDPADQWNVKARSPFGAVVTNFLLLFRDALQPPILPGSERITNAMAGLNQTAFVHWMEKSHGDFSGFYTGNMVYELNCGLGFGLGVYLLFLLGGYWFVRTIPAAGSPNGSSVSWPWRLVPWLAWFGFLLCLAKIGSLHIPRIVAPYYPLVLIPLLRLPRVAVLERKRLFAGLAGFAAATTIFLVVFTPTRPVFPMQTFARLVHRPGLDKLAAQYEYWAYLRDDLAPLREHLPADAKRLGWCGRQHTYEYGLWKPYGSRVLVEIGLPPGTNAPLPPPDLEYVVAPAGGIQVRYGMDVTNWLSVVHGQVLYEYVHNGKLFAHGDPEYESWYVIKLNPAVTNHLAERHESSR